MTEKKKIITRRDFLRAGSCMAVGGLMGLPLLGSSVLAQEQKSRVILIRDKEVLDSKGRIREDVLREMLDQAVSALMETRNPEDAWAQLFSAEDTVGIKSNTWHYLPTPGALEDAIRDRLLTVGIQEGAISVDDRGVLRDPVFAEATALINTRPMRTHDWSGLGTLLKNYIMFTRSPSKYHGNACENLGAIWHFPMVKGKTRLNILVMLTPLFHGAGPHHFSRKYVWNYCGLIVSRDPVSADATGARIVQARRNVFFGNPKPIRPSPHHIVAADTRFGLGNSREERIELVKLGWDQDILI